MTNDFYALESPGRRLRRLRLALGLTLDDVAAVLDSDSASRIAHYEADRREMRRSTAVKIAGVLQTSAAYLLCLDTDNPVLSDEEKEVVDALRSLPPELRQDFTRRIQSLAVIHAPVKASMLASATLEAAASNSKVFTKKQGRDRVNQRRKSRVDRNGGD